LLVLADPARIGHALRLVVLNAGLSSQSGQIHIEATTVGQRVHVHIDDSGSGIAADLAGTVGAPFEVRKPPGIGDSLALFVASRLVAEVDGELVLTLRPNGTRVELRLPRAP
jgi:two-component system C4-dicarboxylate transport sensor histidine kinase DctB